MTKFLVTLETVASTYIEVEADSKEDAVELAFDKAPGICAQCSGWGNPGVTLELGEFDVPLLSDGTEADYTVIEKEDT